MKFSDIEKRADKSNPHMTLDVELNGKEVPIVLRNMMRLSEAEQAELFSVFQAFGEDSKKHLTKEEKESTQIQVLVGRSIAALRTTTQDKETFDEFIEGLRNSYPDDFNIFVIEIFNAYAEETNLGEAGNSKDS